MSFVDVTTDYQRGEGEERHLRTLSDRCWISVLHRLTGFGHWEWETAIVRMRDDNDPEKYARGKWDDRETLIVIGDHREELADKSETEVMQWYAEHAHERNTMETILDAMKEATP